MNSCFLRILQLITEWTMNGFSIPLPKCCWKTTKIIYFFKIFVQKLHVILSFHSYHTYCMFGEVSYPELANVQNKNSFFKKRMKKRKIYIYKYISILYFTWSRVIFCRFFVYSQGDILMWTVRKLHWCGIAVGQISALSEINAMQSMPSGWEEPSWEPSPGLEKSTPQLLGCSTGQGGIPSPRGCQSWPLDCRNKKRTEANFCASVVVKV